MRKHYEREVTETAPILDLKLRLGEGTGAALAMNVVEAAVSVLTEVKTFGGSPGFGGDRMEQSWEAMGYFEI